MADLDLINVIKDMMGSADSALQPKDFEMRGSELWVTLYLANNKILEHELKPAVALFNGPGERLMIVGEEEVYQPCLMAIESAIVEYYRANPDANDAEVTYALQDVIKFLDTEPFKELALKIHRWLRVSLSLTFYTRQEAIACLECVLRSVKVHRRADGARGYLNFIDEHLP